MEVPTLASIKAVKWGKLQLTHWGRDCECWMLDRVWTPWHERYLFLKSGQKDQCAEGIIKEPVLWLRGTLVGHSENSCVFENTNSRSGFVCKGGQVVLVSNLMELNNGMKIINHSLTLTLCAWNLNQYWNDSSLSGKWMQVIPTLWQAV